MHDMMMVLMHGMNKGATGSAMLVCGLILLIVVRRLDRPDWWSIGNSMGADSDWRI